MTVQYFGERVSTVDSVVSTETDPNRPPVDSNTDIVTAPIDAVVVPETPVAATIPVVATADVAPIQETLMGETAYHEAPMSQPVTPVITNAVSPAGLLDREESEQFRLRWNDIQVKFVDEPRAAVQQADALVAEVIEHVTHYFANEHRSLEVQWNHGEDVSTEDYRKALQHYRTFFKRLVV